MIQNPLLPVIEQYSKPAPQAPKFRDGTVQAASPLTVLLDGDDTGTPTTKAPLVGGLSSGDRVSCLIDGRNLTVIGKYGGSTAAPPPGVLMIDGLPYQESGTVSAPSFSLTKYGEIYAGTAYLPLPYYPPNGWAFEVFCISTNGFTMVSTAGQDDTRIILRVLQARSDDSTALKTLGWRLMKR